jgi:hypothetical protein
VRTIAVAAAASILTLSPAALAYRPFDGTDADVAEFGTFELELGPVHWFSQGPADYLIAPATVLNLGLLPRWEIVADFQNFVDFDPPPGQGRDMLRDSDLLLKTVLVPGSLQGAGVWPSVAVELGPLLPNLDGEIGYGASANVIVSKRWQGLTLHSNSWVELTRGALHLDWFEGIILEGSADAPVRPVSELFVEHEWVAGVTTWSALIGGIWRARDGLDLDVGLREARIGEEPASEVRMGLTWTLGIWSERERQRAH